jgi:hypothetical protein
VFFVWYASILLIVINFDGSAARFARRQQKNIINPQTRKGLKPLRVSFVMQKL